MKYGLVNLGQIEAIINKLGGEEGVDALLNGRAEIKYFTHLINLNTDPFIPYDNWKVEEHKPGGQLEWNPVNLALYLSEGQKNGKAIPGNKLYKELAKQMVFNANLLDYLVDRPHLIPEEWKGKVIFFWGTIYRDADGGLYVRCLVFNEGHWQADCIWLVVDFDGDDPALVRAS